MQVQITFIKSGSSSQFGNFAPGDKLRCGAEAARHFVEDASCAVYTEKQPTVEPVVEQAAETQKRTRKAKE